MSGSEQMKLQGMALILVALSACSPAAENSVSNPEPAAEVANSDGTASFRMGNGEIRDDMLRMFDEQGIEYSLGADNSIIYKLADAELIDRIGNEAISEYITRN